MKVGTKLTFSLVVPIVVLIALFSYLDDRSSRARLEHELTREGRVTARIFQLAMQDALRDRQVQDVHDLVDQAGSYETILGLRLFSPDGTTTYQSRSLSDKPFSDADSLRVALRLHRVVQVRERVGEQPVISFLVPLTNSSTPDKALFGAVQIIQLESFINEDALASRRSLALLTVTMILAISFTIFLVTHFGISRRIDELVRSFREVGSGDLETRVPVHSGDELGRLTQEFNAMCERLESSQRSLLAEQEQRRRMESGLRNTERLASLGRLSAGLAHEIGTPLGVISGRAEALQRRLPSSEPAARAVQIIATQIDRITGIVRAMLDFARAREPRLASTELRAVLDKVTEFLQHRFDQKGIRVQTLFEERPTTVAADSDQIHEVFLNLAMNAVDAMPDGGTLRVRIETVERTHLETGGAKRPFASVTFQDSGSGIAPEDLDHVFDPFFTTKEVGEGTGLGLSVSYGIVREHGGWIEVESAPSEGTRVTVYLPLESAAMPEIAASAGGAS